MKPNDVPQLFVCELLPAEARAILQRAAATRIPDHDPMARTKAINQANKKVRRMYPAYFQPEIADSNYVSTPGLSIPVFSEKE